MLDIHELENPMVRDATKKEVGLPDMDKTPRRFSNASLSESSLLVCTSNYRKDCLLNQHTRHPIFESRCGTPEMSAECINLKIEFGGGLELLFSNQRSHRVAIPARIPRSSDASSKDRAGNSTEQDRPADLAYLVVWLRDNLLKERVELFIENGTV